MSDKRFYDLINKKELIINNYQDTYRTYADSKIFESETNVLLLDKIKDQENVFKIWLQYKK